MKTRGRKGIAEVISLHSAVPGTPPPVPIDLSEAEAVLWRNVVATKPWDWFTPDTFPLLKEYCRASVQADALSEQLRRMGSPNDESLRLWKALSSNQSALRKDIKALGAAMRINQHARYDEKKASTRAKTVSTAKPWDFGKK